MGYPNGEIPLTVLGEILGGRLEREATAAWNDLSAEIVKRGGPPLRPEGPISAYRDLAGQKKMRIYWCGQGNCGRAAVPGTSNHGWGRAVDVATQEMAGWLLRLGPKFGWSHEEGARVGEWWHFTYVGGYKPKPDPLAALLPTERKWIEELLGKATPKARKEELKRKIKLQLTVIYREAKKSGWQQRQRGKRFRTLGRYVK